MENFCEAVANAMMDLGLRATPVQADYTGRPQYSIITL